METLLHNFGWIILIGIILFVFLYKRSFNNPFAITSKFIQTDTINYDDFDLRNKVIESLQNSGFGAVDYESSECKFYARTSLNMSSWGENIIIETIKHGDSVKLEFMSICAFPFQIYDWGKNKRNYRRFWKELNKLRH